MVNLSRVKPTKNIEDVRNAQTPNWQEKGDLPDSADPRGPSPTNKQGKATLSEEMTRNDLSNAYQRAVDTSPKSNKQYKQDPEVIGQGIKDSFLRKIGEMAKKAKGKV